MKSKRRSCRQAGSGWGELPAVAPTPRASGVGRTGTKTASSEQASAISRPRRPERVETLDISALALDGAGIAREAVEPRDPWLNAASQNAAGQNAASQSDGRVRFVEGALPGERVRARSVLQKRRFARYVCEEILQPSPERVAAPCPSIATCGGCPLQHASIELQREVRQKALGDALERIARVVPERWLEPLTGAVWGYRRTARLSVIDTRRARHRGRPLPAGRPPVRIGFRERGGHLVTETERCLTLHPAVGERILELRALLSKLSVSAAIPQIEVAVDDAERVAIAIRHLVAMSADDIAQLQRFAAASGWFVFLQPGGSETLHPLESATPDAGNMTPLRYTHPDFGVHVDFGPLDFIQAHGELNRSLAQRAIELLDVQPGHRVLDLYCGLGNFTLPLATRAARVVGLEGSATMLERAAASARSQGIDNTAYQVADLAGEGVESALDAAKHTLGGSPDRVLLDPPRSGAAAVVPWLGRESIARIVYVSCNPATLARDLGVLVHQYGYRVEAAGIMDLFPHTAHVESLVVLSR